MRKTRKKAKKTAKKRLTIRDLSNSRDVKGGRGALANPGVRGTDRALSNT